MAVKVLYTEEELVHLLKAGDERAFSVLYDNYHKALLGVIRKLVSEENLEDVLQEVFVKIWNSRAMYDVSKGRLYTWMLNIARNTSIDHLRSKQNKWDGKIQRGENVVNQSNRVNSVEMAVDAIGLKSIVGQLKEDQRLLIDLAYFGGYTQEEIAEKLSMPLGTVKTKVRAALSMLRKLVS